MKEYFENLNTTIKEYFKILNDEIPEFLYEYINTKPMKRLNTVSALVGSDYVKFINVNFPYTSLTHSIGVALIIWHFTHDKKQTLAGLFHDIATPTFKHCIDFLNGDYEKQESTEELTTKIISDSEEIMSLLNRDGIALEEVDDYKIYPIADNDTPKLSADRLEYTFSDAFTMTNAYSLEDIKEIYDNLKVMKNEDGIDELGFTDLKIAEKFEEGASKLWFLLQTNEDKLKCQFLADIVKEMNNNGLIQKKDLYEFSEAEIIKKIENCEYKYISEAFKKFRNTSKIFEGEEPPKDCYTVSLKVKKRYIIALVNGKRITEISDKISKLIDEFLNFKSPTYGWFDFKIK